MRIKYEADFKEYLESIYISRKSGAPLTPKVISDTLGRLNRIEALLNIRLIEKFNTHQKYSELVKLINDNKELISTSSTGYKYGHSKYVYCIRIYYKFYCWKFSKDFPLISDKRYNK
jgi:hypothetical protein